MLKRFVASICSLLIGTASLGAYAPTVSAAGTSCQELSLTVALGPGLPADQTIAGTLCIPAHYSGPSRQIDVLVHGATYNRSYWDFPVAQPQYSYVSRTLAAGRATLAYDRLGTGQSSRPLSTAITIAADAYVLHQIIQVANAVPTIQKVNVVGHSFGSIVATSEAATYHDADRLVLTGVLHSIGSGQSGVAASFYPAGLDPQFSTSGYDPGYLTTIPGTRGSDFYYAPTTDPSVIAYDEAHKDVVSATQFGDGLAQFYTPAGLNLSDHITVPVLVVAGQNDALFCGGTLDCNNPAAIAAGEAPYYTNTPSLTTSIVASTGHDLALHTTAGASFAAINGWIQTH